MPAGVRPRLSARIVRVTSLDPQTRDSMWRLFEAYYDGADAGRFHRDLDDKDHAIIVRNEDHAVVGFSTLLRYGRAFRGRRCVIVFSGDTILDARYWGDRSLQNAFGRYITATKLMHPFRPVYWFLVSKGYKTYLLLARNFPTHWPRHDRTTPEWVHGLIDALARERFGAAWRPELGVVRYDRPHDRLRTGVASPDASALRNADVRFFVHANVAHAMGDELACLGRIGFALWARYVVKRMRLRPAAGNVEVRPTWSA